MKIESMKDLIGKEVKIYPGDTYLKWGVILDMNEHGVLFRISKSYCDTFKVGSIRFISYSARLTFAYEN